MRLSRFTQRVRKIMFGKNYEVVGCGTAPPGSLRARPFIHAFRDLIHFHFERPRQKNAEIGEHTNKSGQVTIVVALLILQSTGRRAPIVELSNQSLKREARAPMAALR